MKDNQAVLNFPFLEDQQHASAQETSELSSSLTCVLHKRAGAELPNGCCVGCKIHLILCHSISVLEELSESESPPENVYGIQVLYIYTRAEFVHKSTQTSLLLVFFHRFNGEFESESQ
ncbi:hypothetical protein L6452_29876 [Arctium lappa]|uniref:Uncharacterized protein n=1 Tax=Arctium lappa TaxID=4217 RepID=A0ACB8ZHB8_ARCLA|nr:hypothetical protein L6452_29876 [Arctium lappa]